MATERHEKYAQRLRDRAAKLRKENFEDKPWFQKRPKRRTWAEFIGADKHQ